jgi:hypothetical protein
VILQGLQGYEAAAYDFVVAFLACFFGFCIHQIGCSDVLTSSNWCVCRDCKISEQLDYYSAIALLGFSLITAIIRALSLTTEAARVTVAAPIIGFTASHITALMSFIDDYCKHPKLFRLSSFPLYISGNELFPSKGSAYDHHTRRSLLSNVPL